MPGMDGVDLAKEICRIVPELPVYALTANVIGTEEEGLRRAGVRDVLYKPLSRDDLYALLCAHGEVSSAAQIAEPAADYQVETTFAEVVGEKQVDAEVSHLLDSLSLARQEDDFEQIAHHAHGLLGLLKLTGRITHVDLVARLEAAARECRAEEVALLISELKTAHLG